MFIDRDSRNRLAETIESYLDEKITAFQFHEKIHEIAGVSKDPAVDYVVTNLWHFYDDFVDHKVVLDKESWDFFQRLILMLKSDSQIEISTSKKWSITQIFAAIALVLFGLVVWKFGFGEHLLAFAMPFGVVSIFLSNFRQRSSPLPSAMKLALEPFSSVSQLCGIRRSVREFSKKRYPSHLKPRQIRSPTLDKAIMLQFYVMWLMFSPLVLLFQMFPITENETRMVTL